MKANFTIFCVLIMMHISNTQIDHLSCLNTYWKFNSPKPQLAQIRRLWITTQIMCVCMEAAKSTPKAKLVSRECLISQWSAHCHRQRLASACATTHTYTYIHVCKDVFGRVQLMSTKFAKPTHRHLAVSSGHMNE